MKRTYTFGTLALLFSIAFLYQMSRVLGELNCYCDLTTDPHAGGQILFAVVLGLLAVASAIGVDAGSILRQFTGGRFDRRDDPNPIPEGKKDGGT